MADDCILYSSAHEEYLGVLLRYTLNYESVGGGHHFLGHSGTKTLKELFRFLCSQASYYSGMYYWCFWSRRENVLEDQQI